MVGDVLLLQTTVNTVGTKSVTLSQALVSEETGGIIADAKITNVFFDTKTQETLHIMENLGNFWSDLKQPADVV